VVYRSIVSAYILSADDLLLMGRQDPSRGGTWPNAWRIPGGGKKEGETLRQAMVREGGEEVVGLDFSDHELTHLPISAEGASIKTLESGEVVWQAMIFHHFAVRLGGPAADYDLSPGGDLRELGWLNREERAAAEQIPMGKALMSKAGLIDQPTA